MKIEDIKLKIIPDSRGKDTLEATIRAGNLEASASVPSGKSKGSTEAFVLEPELAVNKLDEIRSKILRDFESLEQFDKFLIDLDGTPNKQNLGGNLILALSMAFARLLAKEADLELFELIAKIFVSSQTRSVGHLDHGLKVKMPFCFFNLIEGGVHAVNSLPFQEYLLIPQTNFPKESLEIVMKAIKLLEEKIQKEYGQVRYGDEGGFAVLSGDPLQGLRLLQNFEGKLGLDVAASTLAEKQSLEFYKSIVKEFPILSIEDPFDEEDWDDFSKITAELGEKVWIVGDDLLTTNVARIKKAYDLKAANAVIIKPNQIGTITETIQAVNLAKSFGWKIIVSHRARETMDTFIADLAVGIGADGLKSGCPLQKERLVKYERLVEIERLCHT